MQASHAGMLLRNPVPSHLRCLYTGEFKKCIPTWLLALPPVKIYLVSTLLCLYKKYSQKPKKKMHFGRASWAANGQRLSWVGPAMLVQEILPKT
jgi:hypothetical protein